MVKTFFTKYNPLLFAVAAGFLVSSAFEDFIRRSTCAGTIPLGWSISWAIFAIALAVAAVQTYRR